jgi:hypothetical protein
VESVREEAIVEAAAGVREVADVVAVAVDVREVVVADATVVMVVVAEGGTSACLPRIFTDKATNRTKERTAQRGPFCLSWLGVWGQT